MRKPNGKFELEVRGVLNPKNRRDNIRQGQCDFDNRPAVVGYASGVDVFLCCENCRAKVEGEMLLLKEAVTPLDVAFAG